MAGPEPVGRRSRSPTPRSLPADGRADRQPRRARPRRQDGDDRQPRRARLRRARPAAGRHDRRHPRDRPGRRCSSRTAPATPRHPSDHVELLRDVLATACRSSASASATSCSAARSGFGTYKLPFGHRGINQPVLDKATGRVEITAHNHGFAVDAPHRRASSTSPNGFGRVEVSHVGLNDNVVEGLSCPRHPGVLGAVPPRGRRRPARRQLPVRPLPRHGRRRPQPSTADRKPAPDAQARRHQQRPRHRLRPDRHRPGVRVRLLGHPGVPRAPRGGRARHPRELQPGHDHDRPRLRRRDLHRADHAGRSSRRSSPRSGPTRSCRPSAARPR